ncbi:hypothetical protein A3D42_01940 [Candidatus Nomurabacteria bacterium RIFCSPHIGHO2_02_FULL_41_18]|uniref:Response regulatory domain-containing protein n=1 Tax=Candidatus Nomurabacteria bacterium RIFCSPHIGHO2_02_FULL_41_18 TaxID=1801754 RepID=A0A1F6W6I2_9BACT|nr:MAG: hypothetical protein A2737_00505 [Candidatus Nomurabacteria bacterium RIFCSPHIGHO2_01_FULL_41_71]OGI77295.1 MAG: hypothetical protein A3D42_01940 [Candidatus Nomurabacteria bacterium RIFCSPHIGHO2_02_FULL_41_18]OGI89693.1 MAG: hypothetical protein A3B01_02665 [Candidatus Nomurabacteria bacterium RIFCSPLOWO2_01_FULL_41_52b]OGJ00233.1 MAG: hypothetical protein A3I90_01495 [Candidatus Nomurabacteria bacterium RIFCSPLOWO2_02_FULL_41_9]
MAIGDEPKPNIPPVEVKEKKVVKILYAEDDKIWRRTLQDLLEYRGCVVEAVENGKILLEKLATGAYDLVLTDNDMPVLTGIQALKKIREMEGLRDLPVIVFSGRSSDLEKYVTGLGGTCLNKASTEDLFPAIERALKSDK